MAFALVDIQGQRLKSTRLGCNARGSDREFFAIGRYSTGAMGTRFISLRVSATQCCCRLDVGMHHQPDHLETESKVGRRQRLRGMLINKRVFRLKHAAVARSVLGAAAVLVPMLANAEIRHDYIFVEHSKSETLFCRSMRS